jgi:hypothetical protein
MGETAFLKNLPAWQTLEEAKKQKLRLLEQAIQAKEASLRELAREVPANAGGGMVFGAGNEPETEAGAAIEHVELGSPLGIALLGITPGEEFKIGLGPDHVLAEVEDVI